MSNTGFAKSILPLGAVALLLALSPTLVGCDGNTQYERPRSIDTPVINSDSPIPVGRLKDS